MKKKLLVIDDSPFIATQIAELVKGSDFEVVGHAQTGEEGLILYRSLQPDVVTLDIIMPGIDGLETATMLLEEDNKAKIVILSSLCDFDTVEEVRAIGVKYLVPKPLQKDLFLSTLELLFTQKKKQK